MRAATLIGREWRPDPGRGSQATGVAALCIVLSLLAVSGLPAAAQESEAEALTNDAVAAEVLARISEMVQASGFGQSDDATGSDGLVATNGVPEPASASQTGSPVA